MCMYIHLSPSLSQSILIKNIFHRVLITAQQKQIRLGTMRLQVQSLASLSELRIQHCRELWCRLQTRLGSCVSVAVA